MFLLMLICVAGCAGRPDARVLETVSTPDAAAKQTTVFVATTLTRQTPGRNTFTTRPSTELNYARYTISLPPGHKPAKIEWPKQKPDPARSFAVVDQDALSEGSFLTDVAAGEQRKVAIFVHGYNTNFQEALFRMAQISADTKIDRVPILFAWPSQGAVSGYLADKEAVTYSRDYLAHLLVSLAKGRGNGDIVLFGHSMGAWLVTETLRQLKFEGRTDVISRIRVVLAAPDIDADVFRSQIAVIGKLTPPMTILVSKDDRVLRASSFLSADKQRIGALDVSDPRTRQAALQEGVQIVDISGVKSSDSFNHDRYVDLATVFARTGASPDDPASLGQVGAFVFDAAGATISSPFRLASRLLSPP